MSFRKRPTAVQGPREPQYCGMMVLERPHAAAVAAAAAASARAVMAAALAMAMVAAADVAAAAGPAAQH
jgi:hypothetical protein